MKIRAELLPLDGKYYGTQIKVENDLDCNGPNIIKIWFGYPEYTKEFISPREIEKIMNNPENTKEDIEEILLDWDYNHSESIYEYKVAQEIVKSLNNLELL